MYLELWPPIPLLCALTSRSDSREQTTAFMRLAVGTSRLHHVDGIGLSSRRTYRDSRSRTKRCRHRYPSSPEQSSMSRIDDLRMPTVKHASRLYSVSSTTAPHERYHCLAA